MSKPVKVCGQKTQAGTPCKRNHPCPVHDKKLCQQFKANRAKSQPRMQKLIQGRLSGKTVKQAAKDAGYPDGVLKGKIYQIIDTPEYKEAIERAIKLAHIDTNEIIGRTVGSMRMDLADLFPDDELLQDAKRKGISQNIKKVKRRPVIAGYDPDTAEPIWSRELEVECYSSQEDRKLLVTVFGLEQLPAPNKAAQMKFDAAVDRLMQQARDRGVKLSDDKLKALIVKQLKPAYQGTVSDAVN